MFNLLRIVQQVVQLLMIAVLYHHLQHAPQVRTNLIQYVAVAIVLVVILVVQTSVVMMRIVVLQELALSLLLLFLIPFLKAKIKLLFQLLV
jgi:hypothetical protein